VSSSAWPGLPPHIAGKRAILIGDKPCYRELAGTVPAMKASRSQRGVSGVSHVIR
jgi:hypothetical protein